MEERPLQLHSLSSGGSQTNLESAENIKMSYDKNEQEISQETYSTAGSSKQQNADDNTEDAFLTNHSGHTTSEAENTTEAIVKNDAVDYNYKTNTQQIIEESVDESDDLLPVKSETELQNDDRHPLVNENEMRLISNIQEKEDDRSLLRFNENKGTNGRKRLSPSESEIPVGFEAVLIALGKPGRFIMFQCVLHMLVPFCLSSTVLVYIFTDVSISVHIMEERPLQLHSFSSGGSQTNQESAENIKMLSCEINAQELTKGTYSIAGTSRQQNADDNTEDACLTNHCRPTTREAENTMEAIVKNDAVDYNYKTNTQQIIEESVDESDDLLSVKVETELQNYDRHPLNENEMRLISNIQEKENDPSFLRVNEHKRTNGRKRLSPSESEIPVWFEAVLMALGKPGRFIVFQCFLHMLVRFCLSTTALVYIFTGFEPPHICQKLGNESQLLSHHQLPNLSTYEVHYGKCEITVTSNTSGTLETVATFGCLEGHDFMGSKHISFVSEWDMVCDNVGLKELAQTLLMAGQTLGGIVFTSIADKYGRKPIFLLCNLLLGAAGIGSAYAPNIYVLIAFRFLAGLFQQGTALVSYTLIMELLTAKHRRVAGVLCGLSWTTSVLMFAVMAYLMQYESWRMVQLATALLASNVLVGPFLLCESPRWLVANNKCSQALAIFQKACKSSGQDFEKVKAVFNRHVVPQQADKKNEDNTSVSDNKVEKYSLIDIVRHRTLLVSALIMWFIWITNSTTYFGLYLMSSSLVGNRHLNFLLMSAVDLPADIVNLFVFAYFGRKTVMMGWLLIAGSGLLTATMLRTLGTTELTGILASAFSFLAKFGIGASFNGLFMYTPELFPTNLRSAGLGVCSSISRLGGMVAPYSQSLADVVLWGPGIMFSAMCFLSVILFIKLPETRGQPMPTTIKEMKQRATRRPTIRGADVNNYEEIVIPPKESGVQA